MTEYNYHEYTELIYLYEKLYRELLEADESYDVTRRDELLHKLEKLEDMKEEMEKRIEEGRKEIEKEIEFLSGCLERLESKTSWTSKRLRNKVQEFLDREYNKLNLLKLYELEK